MTTRGENHEAKRLEDANKWEISLKDAARAKRLTYIPLFRMHIATGCLRGRPVKTVRKHIENWKPLGDPEKSRVNPERFKNNCGPVWTPFSADCS